MPERAIHGGVVWAVSPIPRALCYAARFPATKFIVSMRHAASCSFSFLGLSSCDSAARALFRFLGK